MRWLAQIAFVLLGVSIANANTITLADGRAAGAISGAMITALKDINQAQKGIRQGGDFSANEGCLEHVQSHLMLVQTDVQNLEGLFLLAAQMTDASDEAAVLHITDIAVDGFLNADTPLIRGEMNRLSGLCSRFPLPVAKALQSVELIDKAVSLAQSVSKRLKSVARP
jgi:hypothetical protein